MKKVSAVLRTYLFDSKHSNAEKLTEKAKVPKCNVNLKVRHFTEALGMFAS